MIQDGVYAASLMPLNPDLSCNHEALAAHCLSLIEKGCKGVVLFGATGEGASFSTEEKKEALGEVIARGVDPGKIILANGFSCLTDTVDLALYSLESKCLAFLAAPPCFFKNITEEGILSFYREIFSRVSDPRFRIILYHIPQYTGVPLSVEIVTTLRKEFGDAVAGFKESEGNLPLAKAVLKTVPGCKVFVGHERQIPEALRYGASGSISGMANVCPEAVCKLLREEASPDLEKVLKQIGDRFFVTALKALLAAEKDPSWIRVRPPLVPER